MEISRENIRKTVVSSSLQINHLRQDKLEAEHLLASIERSEGKESERYKIQHELVYEIGVALEQSQQLLGRLNLSFISFLEQERAIQQGQSPNFSEEDIAVFDFFGFQPHTNSTKQSRADAASTNGASLAPTQKQTSASLAETKEPDPIVTSNVLLAQQLEQVAVNQTASAKLQASGVQHEDEQTHAAVPPRHSSQQEQRVLDRSISSVNSSSISLNSTASKPQPSPGSSGVARSTSPAKSRNIITAPKDSQGWKDAIEEMKREAALLHAQLKDSFASERKMLVDDLTDAKVELEKRIRQEDELRRALSKLQIENDELKEKAKHADERQVRSLAELRVKYQEKSALVAALESRVQTLETTVQQLKDGRTQAINESNSEKRQFRVLLEDLISRENTMLRQYIDQMKQELEKRNSIIGVEIDQLKKSLTSAGESSALTDQDQKLLKYAEMQLIELENSQYDPTRTVQYRPTDVNDPIDVSVANLLNEINCPVRIEIVQTGPGEYFMDGQLKLSLVDEQLYVRIGTKQELFSDYIKNLYSPFFFQDEDEIVEGSALSVTDPVQSLLFTKKFLPETLRESVDECQHLEERPRFSPFQLLDELVPVPAPRPLHSLPPRQVPHGSVPTQQIGLVGPKHPMTKRPEPRSSSAQKTRVAPTSAPQRSASPPSRTVQHQSHQTLSKKVIQPSKQVASTIKKKSEPSAQMEKVAPAQLPLVGALKDEKAAITTGIDFSKLIPENVGELSEQQIRQLKRLALRKQIEEMQHLQKTKSGSA